jgi:ABC-2 type transport system ATP-binding protein
METTKEAVSFSEKATLLEVHHLRKYYEQVRAVDDISFKIQAGEIYGLLGPNGAGKSTTIKAILGMLNYEGEIKVLEYSPLKEPALVKEHIGYVAEEPLLFGSLTVQEIFNFIASIRKLNQLRASYNAREYLTSLDAIQYYTSIVESLSRGNKQKVQIIAALLHEPKLLVLDEPFSGLDAKTSHLFKELLGVHIQRGGSILMSTHIMEQAQNLCTRIGIINKGKMVAEGTYKELQEHALKSGSSLEDTFLHLTEQSNDIPQIIENLKRLTLKTD